MWNRALVPLVPLVTALLIAGCLSAGTPPVSPTPTPAPGTNITDLLDGGTIELVARGESIQAVNLSIANLADRTIAVTVPIGMYLDSEGGGFQSMITTRAAEVSIPPNRTVLFDVQAACADIDLDVPVNADLFGTIGDSPYPVLVPALTRLDASGATIDAKQSAVWIVTDDASWEDLGTLVQTFDSARAVNENEAIAAMRAVDEAGMDITTAAIWGDRETLLAGATDFSLKSWLEGRR